MDLKEWYFWKQSQSFNCVIFISILSLSFCYMQDRAILIMRTVELFPFGVLCCFIPEEPEQSACLLQESSQWTKLGTQTHQCLLKSLEKIDSFTTMPCMSISSSPAVKRTLLHIHKLTAMQADVHSDTRHFFCDLNRSTFCLLSAQTWRIFSPHKREFSTVQHIYVRQCYTL